MVLRDDEATIERVAKQMAINEGHNPDEIAINRTSITWKDCRAKDIRAVIAVLKAQP